MTNVSHEPYEGEYEDEYDGPQPELVIHWNDWRDISSMPADETGPVMMRSDCLACIAKRDGRAWLVLTSDGDAWVPDDDSTIDRMTHWHPIAKTMTAVAPPTMQPGPFSGDFVHCTEEGLELAEKGRAAATLPPMKPCPFCGGTAVKMRTLLGGACWAECVASGCWANGPGRNSREAAVDAWNKRPAEDALSDQLDDAREDAKRAYMGDDW